MKCLNCSTIPFSLENEIIYITCEKRKIIDKIKLRKNTLEIRLLNILFRTNYFLRFAQCFQKNIHPLNCRITDSVAYIKHPLTITYMMRGASLLYDTALLQYDYRLLRQRAVISSSVLPLVSGTARHTKRAAATHITPYMA